MSQRCPASRQLGFATTYSDKTELDNSSATTSDDMLNTSTSSSANRCHKTTQYAGRAAPVPTQQQTDDSIAFTTARPAMPKALASDCLVDVLTEELRLDKLTHKRPLLRRE